jgi:putative adhesin
MHEFPCPRPITVAIRISGGAAELVAEERDSATVEVTPYDDSPSSREAAAATRVELRGATLVVEAPQNHGWMFGRNAKVRLAIRVPVDSALTVKSASAEVRGDGRYATVSVHSASGNVRVDEVSGDATVNTASGDVRIGSVGGELRAHSASGEIAAEEVGRDASVHSASGDITIDRAGASVNAKTASGNLRVGVASTGVIKAGSASGSVSVGVAAGTGVWLDLSTMSGSTRSDLDLADEPPTGERPSLTLQVRTLSGNIDVHRVSLPAAA